MAKSTVEKYHIRPRRPSSPAWRAFLTTHLTEFVALDVFTRTTVGFTFLFVLIVLAHARREVVYFTATEYRTCQWTAQQFVEAFPWETANTRCWWDLSRARRVLGYEPQDNAETHAKELLQDPPSAWLERIRVHGGAKTDAPFMP